MKTYHIFYKHFFVNCNLFTHETLRSSWGHVSVLTIKNWNLEMVVFEKRWKKDCPEKNLSEQRREPTTNSILGFDAAIWIWTTSVGGECSHHRAIPCSPVRKGSRIHAVMGNTSQAILPWTPIYSQLVDIVAQINQNAELIIDHCDNSLLFLLLLVPPVETSLVASGVEKRLFSRAGYWSLDSSIKQYRMGPLTDYCIRFRWFLSSKGIRRYHFHSRLA